MEEEIAECKVLLRTVGQEALSNQKNADWRIVTDKNGFKTKADAICNQMLCSGLREITPVIEVFSEEVAHELKDRPSVYWLIDPIDGTRSWHDGFSGYVSQMALIVDNQVEFSSIYWPAEDLFFSAENGLALQNGTVLAKSELNQPPILIDNYPNPQGIARKIIEFLPETRYLECGSIGLKAILSMVGKADFFVKDSKFRDWDVAPAMGFLSALGGRICDLSGDPISLGESIEQKKGLLISHSPKLAEKILKTIEEIGDNHDF